MTEAEWNACEQPEPMLDFLRGRASDRQLRLFACACCQSVLRFIPQGHCRDALEVSFRFADGQASPDELAAARAKAISAAADGGTRAAAAWAACETANPSALNAARAASTEAQEQIRRQNPRAAVEEARAQVGFLRDIIGDPFREARAASVRRLARYSSVREIAEGVYAGGPQEDMGALADELEKLGCPVPAVVDHCRSPGPHVRGCWVLDLILTAEAEQRREPERLPGLTAGRPAPAWVQEIRSALAAHLGPKKYRRLLRKAVASAPGPGRVARPAEWDEFVRLNPEYEVSDDGLAEVFAVCTVHGRELEQRIVRGVADDPAIAREPAFLQARGTQFPHAHGEDVGGEWERLVWWCPECQRARSEWMAARADRLL